MFSVALRGSRDSSRRDFFFRITNRLKKKIAEIALGTRPKYAQEDGIAAAQCAAGTGQIRCSNR